MKITGSKTGLAKECLYPFRDDVEWPEDETGAPARLGNAFHKAAEITIRDSTSQCWEALDLIAAVEGVDASERDDLHAMYKVWNDEWSYQLFGRPEVTYAYSSTTGKAREIGQGLTREQVLELKTDDELTCTLDLIDVSTRRGIVAVVDYKTGRGDQPPADDHSQLRFGAFCAARTYGLYRAKVMLMKIRPDGIETDESEMDEFDFDAVEGEVQRWVTDTGTSEPAPGPHCHNGWCPIRTTCPETLAAIVEVSGIPVEDVRRLVPTAITTPNEAGEAHVRLRVIKDVVKACEDQIKKVIKDHGPSTLSNGKVLKLKLEKKETFSKTRLPPESAEAILSQLRSIGAVKETEYYKLQEYAAPRQKKGST